MNASYIDNVLGVLRDILLKLFPMDLIFVHITSNCVNLIQDFVFLLYPCLKSVKNDTYRSKVASCKNPSINKDFMSI